VAIIATKPMLNIRKARKEDAPLILDFIHRLAEFEREPDAVIATEADLIRDGFGPNTIYRCIIAEWNGKAAGFAFFFYNYSTWRGRPGLYLEDLFVLPELRGHGIGKALLQELARIAVNEQCYGIRWMVLEWNERAVKFYESLGAEILGEWETMLLTGAALTSLAGGSAKPSDVKSSDKSTNVDKSDKARTPSASARDSSGLTK
jgi:GNAT superfamily N-acetyltransferase